MSAATASAFDSAVSSFPPAVMLTGPTATGKSAAAMALAQYLPVEIVSVDSAMVYRGMDIGTAKPSLADRATVPHHLLDIVDPAQRYSAARFRADALATMHAITQRGRLPLLVGGTLLYFRALLRGLAALPDADGACRARLEQRAAQIGWPAMHAWLAEVDAAAAQRIHPNDSQRIQRALEVYQLTGRPMSALLQSPHAPPPYRWLRFALVPDSREQLRTRIAARFHAMIDAGLVDEVAALRARGDLSLAHPSVRAVGYRQLWGYLAGEGSRDEAISSAIVATRRYAKRQMTWLRSETGIRHLSIGDANMKEKLLAAVNQWQ